MSQHDLITEYYGSDKQTVYRVQIGSNRLSPISDQSNLAKHFAPRAFFRDVFLPQGYPDSVTDDYVEYQCWDTLQAFCSSLTGTLATEAVMKSVGVGDQSATALAATLTWLLKDGAGMVGRIAFAWAKGSKLDCDSKKWRLVADILNDLAIFVDILTPYFKPFFTYMVCFSSVCRSIVGVAGGATRAALTQHQARRNNLADVSAKDGSQETLVNLSALICSFLLVPLVSGKTALIWTLFCVMTCLHLFSNYRAVRSLRMDTVNESRYRILIRNFFNNGPMNIRDVNRAEPILVSDGGGICRLKLGCRLGEISIFDQSGDRLGHYQIGVNIDQPRSILYQPLFWWRKLASGGKSYVIRVALRGEATAVDVMRAIFHAELIRTELVREGYTRIYEKNLIDSSRDVLDQTFPSFLEKLRQHGWVTTHTLLYCDEWRYNLEKTY